MRLLILLDLNLAVRAQLWATVLAARNFNVMKLGLRRDSCRHIAKRTAGEPEQL